LIASSKCRKPNFTHVLSPRNFNSLLMLHTALFPGNRNKSSSLERDCLSKERRVVGVKPERLLKQTCPPPEIVDVSKSPSLLCVPVKRLREACDLFNKIRFVKGALPPGRCCAMKYMSGRYGNVMIRKSRTARLLCEM